MNQTSIALSRNVFAVAVAFLLVTSTANAATVSWGPSPYLVANPGDPPASQDTPAGFFDFTTPGFQTAWIESFEEGNPTTAPDPFLAITPGDILEPNTLNDVGSSITDSVDGDDGLVDGSGTNAHSWFADGANDVTVTFANGVRAAGLVFTDGSPDSTNILLEAFDADSNSLGVIDAGDLADDFLTGHTMEDRFLGFTNDVTPIKSIKLSMVGGSGLEIDHVHWQEQVPEPSSQFLALFALLGLIGLRRGR